MGLLHNLKARLDPAKSKVSGLAQQHGDKIQHGLDRAARAVDERTKGKYSDRIQTGTGKARDAMDRLAHKNDPGPAPENDPGPGTGGTTPPAGPPPVS
ncbi:antitoxin [Streptomyces sp. Tu 3180]|uniref:antitoxin n=1 Tax=Streptomyces sp. Tu 3180 TaxID=2682611 RepID=UPI00135CF3DB|nr:antitoxin [Streptomyces sp. Tu 3180]KAF3467845.1 antitoxin [Streptomyces sp. Tu 3180]